jgi:predicted nucleic-acid-binding Zn-ribbon protein
VSESIPQCPKCNGTMIRGFIVDHLGRGQWLSNWSEGTPQRSYWTGLKVNDADSIAVGTFRCSVCGYLESYARPEFDVES